MEKSKVEEYKIRLEEIESHLTDENVAQMTKEQIEEYIVLVSKIKARLEILENL